jgi:hypothetical protein
MYNKHAKQRTPYMQCNVRHTCSPMYTIRASYMRLTFLVCRPVHVCLHVSGVRQHEACVHGRSRHRHGHAGARSPAACFCTSITWGECLLPSITEDERGMPWATRGQIRFANILQRSTASGTYTCSSWHLRALQFVMQHVSRVCISWRSARCHVMWPLQRCLATPASDSAVRTHGPVTQWAT